MVILLRDAARPPRLVVAPVPGMHMDKHPPVEAEFSRLVAVDRLEQGDVVEAISAGAQERLALAARFDLVAIDSLSARVALRRVGRGPVVRVEGRLSAEVVQSCVVSLEPVRNRVEEDFVLLYAPEGAEEGHGHVLEEGYGLEDDDWPEPLEKGKIDIGEAVAQQLALALDPYPRKPGVRLEDVIGQREGVGADEPSGSPFAALARLARRNS